MDEELIKLFLKAVPGSRRAANGVVLKHPEGSLYIYNARPHDPDLSPEEEDVAAFCSKKEIIRLRDIKTVHDYLLRIRANAIASSARLVRVILAKKRVRSRKSWSLTDFYNSLNDVPKRYLELLSHNDRRRLRQAAFGFASLNEANAICLGSLLGEIVIVSESLEHFYYFMMIAAAGDEFDFHLCDRVDAILIALRIMKGVEALDFEIDPREKLGGACGPSSGCIPTG